MTRRKLNPRAAALYKKLNGKRHPDDTRKARIILKDVVLQRQLQTVLDNSDLPTSEQVRVVQRLLTALTERVRQERARFLEQLIYNDAMVLMAQQEEIRAVAATFENLAREIAENTFRPRYTMTGRMRTPAPDYQFIGLDLAAVEAVIAAPEESEPEIVLEAEPERPLNRRERRARRAGHAAARPDCPEGEIRRFRRDR